MEVIYNDITFYQIKHFTNYYISKCGQIYSKKYKRTLTPCLTTTGYYFINLHIKGIPQGQRIHRLLAETFIPNPHNKTTVDHINRNKTDNRLENLTWATPTEQNINQNIRKDNTSGHKGITITSRRIVARWRENYIAKTESFSINVYGYDEALKLAIKKRNEMIEKYYMREE
tara:strand:- start:781 stop:1296 length:516 start_codon:yes stop_codon:yes gene_type:complete